MRAADRAHLDGLYATTDDPWDFRGAPYEAERLDAVVRALPRPRYAAALELGCGNGELARRVAPRCDSYTGLDAVPVALAAARAAVPRGRFVEGFLPCALPPAPGAEGYDLVLLSEILYFLDRDGIAEMAARIDRAHSAADLVSVTWTGPTGHALDGEGALAAFMRATLRSWRTARVTEGYRIVTFMPLRRAGR